MGTINVNICGEGEESNLDDRLARMEALLEELLMASRETKALIEALDAATNDLAAEVDEIAAEFEALQSQLAEGATAEELVTINSDLQDKIARLQGVKERLTTLGADPADPIPEVEPEPDDEP